ncbi:unnamed protein product [Closterium sp. NIES-64]|nr:unnamed protein product [Closterium sp. NIES-64]
MFGLADKSSSVTDLPLDLHILVCSELSHLSLFTLPFTFSTMAASDVAATPGVQTGKVKWFNSTKGFGFITPDDGGEELFVHQTSIKAEGFRSLDENEVVEFTIETSEDGRTKAVNVTGPAGSYVKGAPRRDGYGGGGGRFGGGGFGGRGGGRFGGGRGGGRFGGGPGACYNCNMPGHLARDCPTPGMGGGAGGGAPRTCYTCNQPGHIARDCSQVAQ